MQLDQIRHDDRFFFVAGVVLGVAAVGFGFEAVQRPSVPAAIVSPGLAVAARMAFLASALHSRRKPQGDDTTRAPGQ
jgi:hypothetical protein